MSYKIHDLSSSSDECSIVKIYEPSVKLVTLSEDSDDSLPDVCKRIQQKYSNSQLNSKKVVNDIYLENEKKCFKSISASFEVTVPPIASPCLTSKRNAIEKSNSQLPLKKIKVPSSDKTEVKRLKNEDKELKRLQKLAEREKKQALLKSVRSSKPGESHKHITVIIDPLILQINGGATILEVLSSRDVKFEITQQITPSLITFFREEIVYDEADPLNIITETKEVLADEILIVLELHKFLDLVSNKACVNLMLFSKVKVKLVECVEDLAKTVFQFSKAVAEKPFKKNNEESTMIIDKKNCIKIEKDGRGITNAWRQQLQQIRNCAMDEASAIVAEYQTPIALYRAYNECPNEDHARKMLSDILIRRNAGVLSTSRRIGNELSRRVHEVMISDRGHQEII